ncbi:MAG: type VI secretion system tip protein VgrG [Myxococcales bacterium]|nr:type VI secretion system tip protein VgrG [Myxococcales bacterium]
MAVFLIAGQLAGLEWRLIAATGVEAMNELSSFDFLVATGDAAALSSGHRLAQRLVGTDCGFHLGAGAFEEGVTPHGRTGFVAAARYEGSINHDGEVLQSFLLRVVPRAWLLTQRRNSRIFQNVYPHDVVIAMLREHQIAYRFNLARSYNRRTYVLQYDETDWEFVTRILAEEGIAFRFEQAGEDHVAATVPGPSVGDIVSGVAMGIAEHLTSTEPDDPDLPRPFVPRSGRSSVRMGHSVLFFTDDVAPGPMTATLREYEQGAALLPTEPVFTAFSEVTRVRSNASEVTDYDFRRPMTHLYARRSVETQAHPVLLEQYDHHGQHEIPEVDETRATALLEQARRESAAYHLTAYHDRLMIGHELCAAGPSVSTPTGDQQKRLVPFELIHCYLDHGYIAGEGATALRRKVERLQKKALHSREAASAAEVGDAWFELPSFDQRLVYCVFVKSVALGVLYRPERPRRTPRTVTESAVVVGPRAEEIHTDRFGRIKIQFHWDREHNFDDGSSCWVRTAQPWAGTGWGFQFIPRVGMEVLVTFLAGDPDRPVVLGAMYNGTHPVPETLPIKKTRSVIRTQSTPGGGGFNELAFEDQKESERIYFHAQRDFDVDVQRDHRTSVRQDRIETVARDVSIGVTGRQSEQIGRQHLLQVGGPSVSHLGGGQTRVVHLVDQGVVHGESLHTTSGNEISAIGADQVTNVHGARTVLVKGPDVKLIGGMGQDRSTSTTFVNGALTLSATERVVIKAEPVQGDANGSLRLEVGDTFIELTRDRLVLSANHITIVSTEDITAQAGLTRPPPRAVGSQVRPVDDAATLTAPAGAQLGTLVLKGSGAKLQGPEVKVEGDNVTLKATATALVRGRQVRFRGQRVSTEPVEAPGQDGTQTAQPTPPDRTRTQVRLEAPTMKPLEGVALVGCRYRGVISHAAPSAEAGATALAPPDEIVEGTTTAAGEAVFDHLASAKRIALTVWANEVEAFQKYFPLLGGPLVWQIELIAQMPNEEEAAGQRLRLMNLGYRVGTKLLSPTQLDQLSSASLQLFKVHHQVLLPAQPGRQIAQQHPELDALGQPKSYPLDEVFIARPRTAG